MDKVFTDKASGKDTAARTGTAARLRARRRHGRGAQHGSSGAQLDDLRRLVQGLTQRGVRIEFLKEHLTFTGEDFADGEPDAVGNGRVRRVRTRLDPRAAARGHRARQAARAYRGRKKSLSSERIAELRQRVEAGEQKRPLAREFGISRETLYQYLRTDQ